MENTNSVYREPIECTRTAFEYTSDVWIQIILKFPQLNSIIETPTVRKDQLKNVIESNLIKHEQDQLIDISH